MVVKANDIVNRQVSVAQIAHFADIIGANVVIPKAHDLIHVDFVEAHFAQGTNIVGTDVVGRANG